jgi:U6 snRNA-associated Sm-like protein LSm7
MPKAKPTLDLNSHLDCRVLVRFAGGRQVTGVLRGYDQLLNLVLDECEETMRDPSDLYTLLEDKRQLGLIVCRGTAVVMISLVDGSQEIQNPFIQPAH